jgi:hypothetical protein
LQVSEFGAINGLDVRPAPGASASYNVGHRIAVKIGSGDAHASIEELTVGVELGDQGTVRDLTVILEPVDLS